MRTPIAYYGGKTKMLKHIMPRLPYNIRKYSEAYTGGAALLFAKTPSFLEVVNDVDGLIINFYQVMRLSLHPMKYLRWPVWMSEPHLKDKTTVDINYKITLI